MKGRCLQVLKKGLVIGDPAKAMDMGVIQHGFEEGFFWKPGGVEVCLTLAMVDSYT